MELRQLRYAVAVATYRHFTRAAASVPVAQPALSHQVRLLEQELGIELFERSRGGVRLTEAGEIFVLRARRALGEMDAAREEIAALKGLASGRLVLGAMQALGGLDLPRLLAAFHATHPGIDVSLREDSTRDMFTLAARGEVDLAIAALDVDRPAGLDAVALVREPVLVAVPIAHRLASLEAVDFRQLRDETLILFKEGTGLRAVSERAAERAGFVPRVGFQTSSHDRLLALVGEGLGVALVPASAVGNPRPPGVVALPALPGIDRTVGAVWRAGHRHTPAASAFLRLLREHASQVSNAGVPGDTPAPVIPDQAIDD
jgi:DNA-binding transcriptional LysR family regulator